MRSARATGPLLVPAQSEPSGSLEQVRTFGAHPERGPRPPTGRRPGGTTPGRRTARPRCASGSIFDGRQRRGAESAVARGKDRVRRPCPDLDTVRRCSREQQRAGPVLRIGDGGEPPALVAYAGQRERWPRRAALARDARSSRRFGSPRYSRPPCRCIVGRRREAVSTDRRTTPATAFHPREAALERRATGAFAVDHEGVDGVVRQAMRAWSSTCDATSIRDR